MAYGRSTSDWSYSDATVRKALGGLKPDDGSGTAISTAEESYVRAATAEDGEPDGVREPVDNRIRPGNEDNRIESYFSGGYASESDNY